MKESSYEEPEGGHKSPQRLDFNVEVPDDDMMNCNDPMDNESMKEAVLAPKVGMEFEKEDDAYKFYNRYAENIGFSVRKEWINRDRAGMVRRRKYVCSREGHRKKDNQVVDVKIFPKETRIGCQAHMLISLQQNGRYQIIEFEAGHNHVLENPKKVHVLRSHKKSTAAQATVNNTTVGVNVAPKAKFDFMSRLGEGHVNYLHSKRMRAMERFDAGCLLAYFQKRQCEDPSFFYTLQLDEDDHITNIFWTDARMMMAYERFGDVVCFDMTYRANNYGRPFAPFIGVNNHKQPVIFGAALLYDETIESFRWLFKTFHDVMFGMMPKTVLTDQDKVIENALILELPKTAHRICVWHVYQNALKHLCHLFSGSRTFGEDFSRCVFDYDEEQEFIHEWDSFLQKYNLQNNIWLQQLFNEKEKWALPYGRNTFYADIHNALRNDNVNKDLKKHLNIKEDMLQFLHHFQILVDERRCLEAKANFKMTQSSLRLCMRVKILIHASSVYTPEMFEMFQAEFVKGVDLIIKNSDERSTVVKYEVSNDDTSCCYNATFNSLDDTITCSCRKYEFLGILCSHALRVLHHRNVREIPNKYILKRWTREASAISLRPSASGCATEDDHKKVSSQCYNDLFWNLIKIATMAAESQEAYEFVCDFSDKICQGVEEILRKASPKRPAIDSRYKGANPHESEHTRSSGSQKKRPGTEPASTSGTIPGTHNPTVYHPVQTPSLTFSMQVSCSSGLHTMSCNYQSRAQVDQHMPYVYHPLPDVHHQRIPLMYDPHDPSLRNDSYRESVCSASQLSQESSVIGTRQQFEMSTSSEQEHPVEGQTPAIE